MAKRIEDRAAIIANMKAKEKADKKPVMVKAKPAQIDLEEVIEAKAAEIAAETSAKRSAKRSAKKAPSKPAKATKGKAPKADKKPAKTPKETPAEVVANIPDSQVTIKSNTAPSVEIMTELQRAFDFFNARLFEGKLEPVIFSNCRLPKAEGYFWAKQWSRRSGMKGLAHEIGLDFAKLHNKSDEWVLSVLVHEMCHLLVEQIGKAPKKPYHCKYWSAAMIGVGLTPIIIDGKGQVAKDKLTGPNSSHEIEEGGKFKMACQALRDDKFSFSWASQPVQAPEKKDKKKKKAGAKAKHTCPVCERNAWGAPSLYLHCKGDPKDAHELTEMACYREEFNEETGDEGDGE